MAHEGDERRGQRGNRVWIFVLVAVLLVAAVSVTWLFRRDREQEWRSGGADVEMVAGIRALPPAKYGDTLAEMGVQGAFGRTDATQMVVAHVRWSGSPDEHGHYQFILLDDRVAPARPVGGYEAFGPGGPTGPNWDGRYDALADHYPWLDGVTRSAGRRTDGPEALGLSAVSDGEATLAYWLGPDALPTSRPEQDLRLAVVYVADGGEVRWAKQVPLRSLT